MNWGEGGHKLEDGTHKAHNVGELRDQTWDSLQENMTIQWEKHWDAEEAEESSEGKSTPRLLSTRAASALNWPLLDCIHLLSTSTHSSTSWIFSSYCIRVAGSQLPHTLHTAVQREGGVIECGYEFKIPPLSLYINKPLLYLGGTAVTWSALLCYVKISLYNYEHAQCHQLVRFLR